MASNELLVLTGASGFLGFRVLTTALKAGYNVRIVVRSVSKANNVINSPAIKALQPKGLSFAVVENMAATNAFDEALKGATYVVHCASPMPSLRGDVTTLDKLDEFFVQTACMGVIGLLEGIQKTGTVRRMVLTSSVAGIVPASYFMGQGDNKIFDAESRTTLDPGPYGSQFQAYMASKIAAINSADAWMSKNKPSSFDLITIIPGGIYGDDEQATTPEYFGGDSTNSFIMGLLQGSVSDIPILSNAVHVNDLAQLHVAALSPKIPGNQSFTTSSDGIDGVVLQNSIDIIKKHFPEAIEQGLLRTTGKLPTAVIRIDAKKTEETFGIKFVDFEGIVKSIVNQYLEITKASGTGSSVSPSINL